MEEDPREQLRSWLASGRLPTPGDARRGRLLAETAAEQGVAGALHEALLREPRAEWPARARVLLRRSHRLALSRGLRQLSQAGAIQRDLLAVGVRSLPLKGAAVAESLYDSPALRPMADVDMVVLEGWTTALRTLASRGFREVQAGDHAVALRDPETDSIVELHHSVTSCAGFFPVNVENAWRRRVAGPGAIAWLPGTADLLVHLSLHATFQHGLVLSLGQHVDFVRLMEAAAPQLRDVDEVCAEMRASAAVALALRLSSTVVGTKLPAEWLAWIVARMSPRLDAILRERRAVEWLPPAAPALLRTRWALSAGRRAEFVRRSVFVGVGEPAPSWSQRLGAAFARSARLARRYAAPRLW
jgi:hypothetical protein